MGAFQAVGGLEAEVSQWFVTQIAGDNCPAIAFSWGTQYQDRDYYVDMTKYYNEPNEYVEGNEKWSDLFEDYLFETSTVRDIKGQLVGVPITLYAGPATGWYYNTDLISKTQIPKNWEQFVTLGQGTQQGPRDHGGRALVVFQEDLARQLDHAVHHRAEHRELYHGADRLQQG